MATAELEKPKGTNAVSAEAAAAGVDKATPHTRFLANLHNKYKEAIAAQQAVIEENYESADALKKYNAVLKSLTAFIKKNQMGIMLPTGESFKATMNPHMEDQVTKLREFGDIVKKNTEVQTKLYQVISKLQTETKGSTKFSKTYSSLRQLSERANLLTLPERGEGEDISSLRRTEAPSYARNISRALRRAITQATDQLQKDDTWIPKFIMNKKNKPTLSGPFDYTSSQFELLKKPGHELALSGGGFRMGPVSMDPREERLKRLSIRATSTTGRMVDAPDTSGQYRYGKPGESSNVPAIIGETFRKGLPAVLTQLKEFIMMAQQPSSNKEIDFQEVTLTRDQIQEERYKRRESRRKKDMEMEKDMYGTYVHPGEGMGGIGGLPVPRSYGYQWKGTGEGVGPNKDKWQAGAGTFGWGGPLGPPNAGGVPVYSGQNVNATIIPPPPPPGNIPTPPFPYGTPNFGIFMPIASAVIGLGKLIYDFPRAFSAHIADLQQPLESLYRAGTTTGQGTEATARFFSGGDATPTVSPYWSTLGYRNSTELYETQAAYQAQFRPEQATVEASMLSQNPLTGFQSAKEYMPFEHKLSDMGLNFRPGEMEKDNAAYTEAVRKGVEKGISAVQVFKTLNMVLDQMKSSGIVPDFGRAADLSVVGAGSAIQSLRDGTGQIAELSSYKDTLNNIVAEPFDLNALMTYSLSRYGTATPSAKQIEELTKNKFSPDQAKVIEGNRGFAAGGSLAVASKLIAHNSDMNKDFMYDVYMDNARKQFPNASEENIKYLMMLSVKDSALDSVMAKMNLDSKVPKLLEGGSLPAGIPSPTDPDQWIKYLERTHRGIVGYTDEPGSAASSADDLLGGSRISEKPVYGDVDSFKPGLSPISGKFGTAAAHTRGFMYTPGGTVAGVPLPKAPSDIPTMGVGTLRNIDTNAINQSLHEADIELGIFGTAVKDLGTTINNVLGLIQRHMPDWGAPTSGGGFTPVPAHHPGAGTP